MPFESPMPEIPSLTGNHIRLEPINLHHLDGLLAAATADPSLYQWTVVPQTRAAMQAYIETAMALRERGTGLPFATVRMEDGAVIGATRFFDMERWSWPAAHARHGNPHPDVCEIGYTWLTRSAIPVSYTHLDVYKRQDLRSGSTDRTLSSNLAHPDRTRNPTTAVLSLSQRSRPRAQRFARTLCQVRFLRPVPAKPIFVTL